MANKYKNNFLSNVITRIDFLKNLHQVNSELPEQLKSKIKETLPKGKMKEFVSDGVKLTIKKEGGVEAKETEKKVIR